MFDASLTPSSQSALEHAGFACRLAFAKRGFRLRPRRGFSLAIEPRDERPLVVTVGNLRVKRLLDPTMQQEVCVLEGSLEWPVLLTVNLERRQRCTAGEWRSALGDEMHALESRVKQEWVQRGHAPPASAIDTQVWPHGPTWTLAGAGSVFLHMWTGEGEARVELLASASLAHCTLDAFVRAWVTATVIGGPAR